MNRFIIYISFITLLLQTACTRNILLSTVLQPYKQDYTIEQPVVLRKSNIHEVNRYLIRKRDTLLIEQACYNQGLKISGQILQFNRRGSPIGVNKTTYSYLSNKTNEISFTQTVSKHRYINNSINKHYSTIIVRQGKRSVDMLGRLNTLIWMLGPKGDTIYLSHTFGEDTTRVAARWDRPLFAGFDANGPSGQYLRVISTPVTYTNTLNTIATLRFCPESVPGLPDPHNTADPWGAYMMSLDYNFFIEPADRLPHLQPHIERLLVERGYLSNGVKFKSQTRLRYADYSMQLLYPLADTPNSNPYNLIFTCVQKQIDKIPVAEQYLIRRHTTPLIRLGITAERRQTPFRFHRKFNHYSLYYKYDRSHM